MQKFRKVEFVLYAVQSIQDFAVKNHNKCETIAQLNR